jgi:hypothetical protein
LAGSFSVYLENLVLYHTFNGAAFTSPATVYVALFTATPSDTGGGTEVSGNAYARVAVTGNTTNFPTTSTGSISNGTAITFPQATPSGWGVITQFGIFDASTSGNLLVWGDLSASKTVDPLDTVSFAIGALTITLA